MLLLRYKYYHTNVIVRNCLKNVRSTQYNGRVQCYLFCQVAYLNTASRMEHCDSANLEDIILSSEHAQERSHGYAVNKRIRECSV